MSSTPEGRVKARLKARLRKEFGDCLWQFMPVQSGFGSVALDFLLCIHGRFVAIETKAGRKKLTPLQQSTAASIRSAGGLALVAYDDATIETCIKIIKWKVEWWNYEDDERRANYRGGNTAPQGGWACEEYVQTTVYDQAAE